VPTVSAHFRSLLATQWDLGQSVIAAHDAYGMGEYTRTVQANSIISKLAVKRLCLSVFFKYLNIFGLQTFRRRQSGVVSNSVGRLTTRNGKRGTGKRGTKFAGVETAGRENTGASCVWVARRNTINVVRGCV